MSRLTVEEMTPKDTDNTNAKQRQRVREFCERNGFPVPKWAKRIREVQFSNSHPPKGHRQHEITYFQFGSLFLADYEHKRGDDKKAMDVFRDGLAKLTASRKYIDGEDKLKCFDRLVSICNAVKSTDEFTRVNEMCNSARRFLLDIDISTCSAPKERRVRTAEEIRESMDRSNAFKREKRAREREGFIESLRATGRLDDERLVKYGFKGNADN